MNRGRITNEAQLREALACEHFLLFKHSLVCPVSARAYREYGTFLEDAPSTLQTGWIDVIGARPLSLAVAAETGVRHESPQALLLSAGQVRWHASHGAITRTSLAEATLELGA